MVADNDMRLDRLPMIQAIFATAESVGSLAKESKNTYAKYNYVSIDAYYEQVARVARGKGLTWVVSEDSREVVRDHDGNVQFIIFTYNFDMMHVSGVEWPAAALLSVVHPVQGPQTTGSALSYAEKMFMRQMFKVVTGEDDADAIDPASTKPQTPKAASVKKAADDSIVDAAVKAVTRDDGVIDIGLLEKDSPVAAQIIENAITLFIPEVKTPEDLKRFWTSNDDALKTLEKLDPAAHLRVKTLFVKTADKLKGKK